MTPWPTNTVCKKMTDVKLLPLPSKTGNCLTLCKKDFRYVMKFYLQNVFKNHIYLVNMYKEDLALNNLQWLICHKTQPNQIIYI